jgi:UDP:flavonoid glycosyltransferase YjiC (YdhE family)
MIAAEAAGIPRVALFHMPEYLPGPNRPPGGFGLNPKGGSLGRIRDLLLTRMFTLITNRFLPRINAVRQEFHLTPLKSFADIYHQVDLRMIQTCKAFDFPIVPEPANVRYVGPVLEDPDWSHSAPVDGIVKSADPLVVVSLSSTFQNQRRTIENAITAIAGLPVKGLVTLGPSMAKERFAAANNVTIVPAIPHSQVFPLANAVVTHAGHGTLMRALAHGLPVVCLPMGRDQTDNAARIVHQGAGLKLSAKAGPHRIAAAINRVLNEPEFTRNAERLKGLILADTRSNQAVQELEKIAGVNSWIG